MISLDIDKDSSLTLFKAEKALFKLVKFFSSDNYTACFKYSSGSILSVIELLVSISLLWTEFALT